MADDAVIVKAVAESHIYSVWLLARSHPSQRRRATQGAWARPRSILKRPLRWPVSQNARGAGRGRRRDLAFSHNGPRDEQDDGEGCESASPFIEGRPGAAAFVVLA